MYKYLSDKNLPTIKKFLQHIGKYVVKLVLDFRVLKYEKLFGGSHFGWITIY